MNYGYFEFEIFDNDNNGQLNKIPYDCIQFENSKYLYINSEISLIILKSIEYEYENQ